LLGVAPHSLTFTRGWEKKEYGTLPPRSGAEVRRSVIASGVAGGGKSSTKSARIERGMRLTQD